MGLGAPDGYVTLPLDDTMVCIVVGAFVVAGGEVLVPEAAEFFGFGTKAPVELPLDVP